MIEKRKRGRRMIEIKDLTKSFDGVEVLSHISMTLEKGKIYTISKADFTFDESNLSTIPNTSAVSVWLKVTVKAWTVVPVKPNL